MEAESQNHVSQELQKVLLSADLSLLRSPDSRSVMNSNAHGMSTIDVHDDILELDEHSFKKLVPLLRNSIEESTLNSVVDDLLNSVDDNFESLESQIMQDSQVNDNLTTSIKEMASIKHLIDGSLQGELKVLQEQLAASTNDVILKKQFFINNKKTTTKISESIILINKILQILELSNKCQDLIKDGNFFKALQSLGSLEKIYLQDFKNYNFEFLKEINASIPLLKSKIKDESINLIKSSFNSKLESTLLTVGTKYYDFYNDVLLQDWLNSKTSMKLGNFKFNSPLEISLREPQKLEELRLDHYYHLDEFYDSILIFQELKELDYLCDEFTKEYEFRKSKVIYPLELKTSASSSLAKKGKDIKTLFGAEFSMNILQQYMLKLLGFLIYDKHLNKATDYVLSYNSYSTTDDFWNTFMTKFSPYLEQFVSQYLNTEADLIKFKDFLGVYIAILENLKLNIEIIYKIHIAIFEKYSALLVHLFKSEFSTLLSDDDFMPLTINDKGLYEKVLKICWLDDELKQNANVEEKSEDDFFATLPFSPLYPMTCTLAKKTYHNLIGFLSNFYQHDLNHLNYLLVQTIDQIFSNIVNRNMKEKLDTTSREEIAQILINFDYFVLAVREFSNILTRENITENPEVEIRLVSIQHLTESRKFAETKLIELIDSKVSDLLEFVQFNWSTTDLEQEPDISIRDIAQFLEMMFTSTLVNLPYSVKTLLIFREFDALTRKFLELLLDDTPSTISPQSVLNFQLNMEFLESVISKIFPNESDDILAKLDSPIPQSPEPSDNSRSSNLIENNIRSLQSTFTDLKQHIEFLKSENMEEYKDPSIRMRKYPRIKPEVAQTLYKKVYIRPQSNDYEIEKSSTPDQSMSDSITSNRRIAKFFNRT